MQNARQSTAKFMVNYLKETVECGNIMEFIKEHATKDSLKMTINGRPTDIQIININREIDPKISKTLDIMMEFNYSDNECFPYLYGILICRNDDTKSGKGYILYEGQDGYLFDLLKHLTNQSDWYELIFQIIIINYYLRDYKFNSTSNVYQYRALTNARRKDYTLSNVDIKIYHKFVVSVTGLTVIENNGEINLDILKDVKTLAETVDVKPSLRAIELIDEVLEHPDKIPDILVKYYMKHDPAP
jgi:hypothetical protein